MTLLYVALGGALGAVLRALSVGWAARVFGPQFPYGVMAVNVVGSFAMGLLAAALMERAAGGADAFVNRVAPFAMTGVLGGFTTFSAFSLDAYYLVERGRLVDAAVYVGGSVILSILGLAAGLLLGRAVWG